MITDLANRLEAAVAVGAYARRGLKLRKLKENPGEDANSD